MIALNGVSHLPTNTHYIFFLGKEVTVFTFRRNKIFVRTWTNYFFVMFNICLNLYNKNLIRFLPKKRLDNEKDMPSWRKQINFLRIDTGGR